MLMKPQSNSRPAPANIPSIPLVLKVVIIDETTTVAILFPRFSLSREVSLEKLYGTTNTRGSSAPEKPNSLTYKELLLISNYSKVPILASL